MKIEQILKLVAVTKPKDPSPIINRRDKLVSSINRQLAIIERYALGESVRGKWFWTNDSGGYYLPIKYGKQVLELGKGKFAIECSNLDEVEDALIKVRALIKQGDFDSVLENTSKEIRSKFMK